MVILLGLGHSAQAADLVVELGKSAGIQKVGAIQRFQGDGQSRRPIDPKAKIDAPALDAVAEPLAGNRWVFRGLSPGRYDLLILAQDRVRVEGFHYPPLQEFDPVLAPSATAPVEAQTQIQTVIKKSAHYENRVDLLFAAGNDKSVRVLMQLVRDQPTSFDAEYGQPIATVRHEVWQFQYRYGGWVKEKKTVLLDRILMPRQEFQGWTWVWDPVLGGIDVANQPITLSYELPDRPDPATARGLFPR